MPDSADDERAKQWAWSCAEAYSAALTAERLRANKLASAIQAFMRGDGDFADQMAEALDEWDAARH